MASYYSNGSLKNKCKCIISGYERMQSKGTKEWPGKRTNKRTLEKLSLMEAN